MNSGLSFNRLMIQRQELTASAKNPSVQEQLTHVMFA